MKTETDNNSNQFDQRKIDFYNRLFLNRIFPEDNAQGIKKNLSGLSYRLAWLLSNELDFDNPKKLPSRKILAEQLSTTTSAIHESLAQLEMAGVIIRSTDTSSIMYYDKNLEIQYSHKFKKYIKKEIETRSFKDYFCLNLFCNMSQIEITNYIINRYLELALTPPHIYNYLNYNCNYKDVIFNRLIKMNIIQDNLYGSIDQTFQYVSQLIDKFIQE